MTEAGHVQEAADRKFLSQQVGVLDDEASVRIPLLYALLARTRSAAGIQPTSQ